NFTKVSRKPFTKLEEFVKYDTHENNYANGIATTAGGFFGGAGSFSRRNNCAPDSAGAAVWTNSGDNEGAGPIVDPQTLSASASGRRYDNTESGTGGIEPQYLEATVVTANPTLANTQNNYQLNCSIPFYTIKKCLLSLNKD